MQRTGMGMARPMALILAAAIAFATGSALANEQTKKPAKREKAKSAAPAPIDPALLDKRVAESKTIFVGEGARIYFVDRQYRETPYIRAAGEGADRSAMIVVKVVKVLHPPGASVPEKILVPIETSRNVLGEGRSPYDEQVARHIGKQGIWFGEIAVRREYGEGAGRKPLEDPITVLQPGSADAKRKLAANSLPIAQLKDVEAAVARVKSGKAVVAAEPPAEKP